MSLSLPSERLTHLIFFLYVSLKNPHKRRCRGNAIEERKEFIEISIVILSPCYHPEMISKLQCDDVSVGEIRP